MAEWASTPGSVPGSRSQSANETLSAVRMRVLRRVAFADAPIARWFGDLALLDDALGDPEGADAAREAFPACAERPASVERLVQAAAGRK